MQDSDKEVRTEENLLKFYQSEFQRKGIWPKRLDPANPDSLIKNYNTALGHAAWMVEEILRSNWIDTGKVNRWIGFIQGTLWMTNVYTVDELRQHVIAARG